MRKITSIVLALVILVGVSSTVMAIGLASFGVVRITSVQTSSMSPEINSGSLTVSTRTPTSKIKAGDVISTRTVDGNSEDVLGRVVSIEAVDGGIYEYSLKSDQNPLPDEWVYKTSGDTYKLSYSIPVLGHFIQFLKTPVGAILYILAIAGLAFVYLKKMHDPISAQKKIAKQRLKAQRLAESKKHDGVDEIEALLELAKNKE